MTRFQILQVSALVMSIPKSSTTISPCVSWRWLVWCFCQSLERQKAGCESQALTVCQSLALLAWETEKGSNDTIPIW